MRNSTILAATWRDGLFVFSGEACHHELAGSSLGKTALSEQIADTLPDVVLERAPEGHLEDVLTRDPEARSIPIVLLSGEKPLPAVRTVESDLRGILPSRASEKEILAAIEAAAAGLIVWHPDFTEYVATMTEGAPRVPSGSTGQQLSA